MSQTLSQTTQVSHPLETEKISRLLRRFAIPCIISLVVNALYNIVDQIFIGQSVGYLGTAATNVSFPMVTIAFAFALLIGDGGAAYYSIKLGGRYKDSAAKGVGNALVMLLVSGIVFMVVGLIFLEPLLYFFGATEAVFPYAKAYTSIILFGLPFMIISAGFNSIIRADSSPRYAMTSMIVGAVINTVLDPILIFGFDMGVEGAAIATIIGQFIACLISLWYLRRFQNIQFDRRLLKLDSDTCKTVLSFGLASFITQASITVIIIIMNNSLAYYGAASIYGAEIPLSALGIVMKVNMIMISIIIGISIGAQPIWGYNYGAKNYDRVKQTYKLAITVSLICASVAFIFFMFLPDYIIALFGKTDELYKEFARKCFRIFLMFCIANAFQIVTSIYFQATGNPKISTLLSLSRQIIFLLPPLIILPRIFGLEGTLYSGPIADILAFALALVLIIREMARLDKKQAEMMQKQEPKPEALIKGASL